MIKNKMNRMGLGIALVGLALGATSVAFAQGAERQCVGQGDHTAMTPEQKAQRATERFQKADKNSDGFLTKDEVGDQRWEHIKVADANNDGKISLAEMQQAHKDGKLGHHGHKPA
jgi:Ca2+-binding EF-hand superfamily protein